jgi:ribosomal protein S10
LLDSWSGGEFKYLIYTINLNFISRKIKFERSLNEMTWKVNHADLKKVERDLLGSMVMTMLCYTLQQIATILQQFLRVSKASNLHHSGPIVGPELHKSLTTLNRPDTAGSEHSGGHMSQVFIGRAQYKGNVTAIKTVRKQKIKIDRELLLEMRNVGLVHLGLNVCETQVL